MIDLICPIYGSASHSIDPQLSEHAADEFGIEIVMDAIAYQMQEQGGITRLYSEIMPRMCELDETLHVRLFTTGRCRQPLPWHAGITHQHLLATDDILRPGRLFSEVRPLARQAVARHAIKPNSRAIWHSTYYTLPSAWKGPVVVTVLDMIHEKFPDLLRGRVSEEVRQAKRKLVNRANAVICISESTKQDLLEYYKCAVKQIFVIPLAPSTVFRPSDLSETGVGFTRNKPFLLYIGGRQHYKNFGILLHAYGHWAHRADVDLVVVGANWSKSELEELHALKVEQTVKLMTSVSDELLRDLYSTAAAFVYPSLYEGFGVPILEALACGCPVAASRIPSSVEVGSQEVAYFNPYSTEELLAALDECLTQSRTDAWRTRRIKRAQSYSWDTTAAATLSVYRSLF